MLSCMFIFINSRIYQIPIYELCKIFFPTLWFSICLVGIIYYLLFPLGDNQHPHWFTCGILTYIAFIGVMFCLHIHYNLRRSGYALLSQVKERKNFLKCRKCSSLSHSIFGSFSQFVLTVLLIVFSQIKLDLSSEYCAWLTIAFLVNFLWLIVAVFTWRHYKKVLDNIQGIELIEASESLLEAL